MTPRWIGSLLAQQAFFAGLILGPTYGLTGSIAWPRGWLALGVLFAASALGGWWFAKTDPDLVRERAQAPRPKTHADAVATGTIALAIVLWLVGAVWEVHRLGLLPLPAWVSLTGGLALFLGGVALIVAALRANTFAITVVSVQSERAQQVIDTGPYALVRHPMYLGALAFFAGLGLILGSTAAAFLAPLVFTLAFLPRIQVEEATLTRDLAGYADYRRRVRSRILPGVL